MTAFRIALYTVEGSLVKTYVGRPLWRDATAQQTADMVARSADAGCTYSSGVVAVWTDPAVIPAAVLAVAGRPDAVRVFGPDQPAVPEYRWKHGTDWSTVLAPA